MEKNRTHARLLNPTDNDLDLATSALLRGELVAIPTETVYGLAADATSADAVLKIFEAKSRPLFDPLIVHVGRWAPYDEVQLDELERRGIISTATLSPTLRKKISNLMATFWPGPLTLLLPKGPAIPDAVTSGLARVAVRMPAHSIALELIERADRPLAAPSANRFGRISPTSASAVQQELGDRIPWIMDGGPSTVGVESTILGFTDRITDITHSDAGDPGETPILLRTGGVSRTELSKVLGTLVLTHLSPDKTLAAPGMLPSHYAPSTPLRLASATLPLSALERDLSPQVTALGVLLFSAGNGREAVFTTEARLTTPTRQVLVRPLSESGDPKQAARHLFEVLRELDNQMTAWQPDPQRRVILAERPPAALCDVTSPSGLGLAILDRLERAATK